MKIVHLIFSFEIGGAETMLVDIVNQQVKTNSVSLIIVNDRYSKNLLSNIDNRVKVFLIERPERSYNPFYVIKLNAILARLKVDVVHCHNNKLIKLLFGKYKYCLTIHDNNIPVENFKYYSTLFAVSNAVKIDVVSRSEFYPIVIENGINISSISPKSDFIHNEFRIVQISRLNHQKKGQDILVDALKKLVYEHKMTQISIDFIGDSEIEECLSSKKHIETLIEENNLNDYVNFLGTKSRQWIYENLRNYSLLVQPSRYEGFGLTVAEAMAAKVPVLVSNIDGPIEIIKNGEFGHFFKSGNSDDCALRIKEIIEHYDEKKELLEKAYRHCVDNYSIERTAKKYIENY